MGGNNKVTITYWKQVSSNQGGTTKSYGTAVLKPNASYPAGTRIYSLPVT